MKKSLFLLALLLLTACQSGGNSSLSTPVGGESLPNASLPVSVEIEDGYTSSSTWPKDVIDSVLSTNEEVPEYKNFGTLTYKVDQDGIHPCVIIKIVGGSDKTYKGYLLGSDNYRVYDKGVYDESYYTAENNLETIWLRFATIDNVFELYIENWN